MAQFDRRDRTTTRHEYVLSNPVNWAEVGKAFAAARQDMEAAGVSPDWDDVVWVTHADEEIVVYWETKG